MIYCLSFISIFRWDFIKISATLINFQILFTSFVVGVILQLLIIDGQKDIRKSTKLQNWSDLKRMKRTIKNNRDIFQISKWTIKENILEI